MEYYPQLKLSNSLSCLHVQVYEICHKNKPCQPVQTVRFFNLILLPEGAVSLNETENKKDRQCLLISKTYFKFSVSLSSQELPASKVNA